MNRNSTTLFLTSPGAITPVLWVNNAPSFSGFEEPTLSVLQQAWVEFLESGEELEVIPDPELPSPSPDWNGFVMEFTDPLSSLYNTLYNATANLVQLSTPFTQEHWQNIRIGLSSGLLWDTDKFQNSIAYLQFLLNSDGNPLNESQKSAWVSLATNYNISLVL